MFRGWVQAGPLLCTTRSQVQAKLDKVLHEQAKANLQEHSDAFMLVLQLWLQDACTQRGSSSRRMSLMRTLWRLEQDSHFYCQCPS